MHNKGYVVVVKNRVRDQEGISIKAVDYYQFEIFPCYAYGVVIPRDESQYTPLP